MQTTTAGGTILQPREILVTAANANRYVQEYRADREWWASCWSEENVARNPPVRVEFEHATFFGSLAEAFSVRKGKTSWGSFLRVDPLREDDVLHPTRVVYVLKETNPMRQRWEFRDTLKRILGKDRRLVNEAVRQCKKVFVANLSDSDRRILRGVLDLTPSGFCQAARFGERYGPNGIQAFVTRLEERTKGYRLNFHQTVPSDNERNPAIQP
jgi:hypothetical protein